MPKHIAILDFGSQYMHLITRRIRQLGVRSQIYPMDVNAHELRNAWGIVLSGGPQSVVEQKFAYDPGIFKLGKPILGLCYGHQLMAHYLGGVVTPAHNREYGKAAVTILLTASPFTRGLRPQEQVWMSHWDSVTKVPKGFQVIAKTDDCPVAGMANEKMHFYGLQFHPEVHHTTHGMRLLKNFVFDICGAQKNWSMAQYLKELAHDVGQFVGDRRVFLLVSGGVDSTVAFALLEKILGKKRVYGLHIDNGFMRWEEAHRVGRALAAAGFDDLHVVDGRKDFLAAVRNVVDPEEKRKRIGKTFLVVQKRVFMELGFNSHEWLLGQGTIYPDTIESGGTQAADVIKTHHNRVDEILEMINQGKIIEPLSALYKDEVRALGRRLGLQDSILQRWPFPGPGLAIRCLCSDGKPRKVKNEKRINKQLQTLAAPQGFSAAVLPLWSVGVQGDQRSYQHPAMLFGRNAKEVAGMWRELDRCSTSITNNVIGINRVVVAVGGNVQPQTMRVRKGYLTVRRLDLLRRADDVIARRTMRADIHKKIWQFPVILLPLSFGRGETIVLRPIESQEAMTVNFYRMDALLLHRMTQQLLRLHGINAVLYDITNKPPATIEWE